MVLCASTEFLFAYVLAPNESLFTCDGKPPIQIPIKERMFAIRLFLCCSCSLIVHVLCRVGLSHSGSWPTSSELSLHTGLTCYLGRRSLLAANLLSG
jgi:hypothetical protein